MSGAVVQLRPHPLGPLEYITRFRAFVVVRIVPKANGKSDKLPLRHDTGKVCDPHDPTAWTDYTTAAAVVARDGPPFRVGYVLHDDDDLIVIDIDGCGGPGKPWSELALSLCRRLQGTVVVERSQSDTGMHIWARRSAVPEHAKKNIALGLECYSDKRLMCLGSDPIGTLAEDCPAIDAVIAEYFPPRLAASTAAPDEGPRADWQGPTDDADLIRRAMMSKSAGAVFGNKASFADLWHADERVLSKAYPADASSSEPYDRSSADAALAAHLAFWCGCDVARIERLMRQSKLAREKWDDRHDYLVERTIKGACEQQREVLIDKPSAVQEPEVPVSADTPQMTKVNGRTFLDPAEQIKLFAGCVYVQDAHAVLVSGGKLLKPDRFRAKFGGYSFTMDARGEKVSRNAFEAFTESQVLRKPTADSTCFRPDLPFGFIVKRGRSTAVNVYQSPEIPDGPDDEAALRAEAAPFLNHIDKLFCDPQDRMFALYYAANIVQHVGNKFQFAALIIGAQGNGKTFLSEAIAEAVGYDYAHPVPAHKLNPQFNTYLDSSVFCYVEDVLTSKDPDILETLKVLITGRKSQIEGKGIDQRKADVCANWMFNSNHLEAIRKTGEDRRYLILLCAQQSAAQVQRDGLDARYFERLHGWANRGGYAKISRLLHKLKIPIEYGLPWVMGRAPVTRGDQEVIEATRTDTEHAILDAIDREPTGFRGGWISTHALARETSHIRGQPSQHARGKFIESLSYVKHPALMPKGQVPNTVQPDGAKPVLYLKAGHPALTLTLPADVAKAYTVAQMTGLSLPST